MRSCLPSLRPPGSPKKQNLNMQNTNSCIDMEDNRQILPKDRRQKMWQGVCGIFSLVVIYLISELLIWGLSRALAPAKLDFFSSVFGMLLVFVIMMIACAVLPNLDGFYKKHIRSKVDFINRHMGAAFAIPMVMLGGNYTISTKTIGLVVGVFVATSLVAWTTTFMLARLAHLVITKIISLLPQSAESGPAVPAAQQNSSQGSVMCQNSDHSDNTKVSDTASPRQPRAWNWLCQFWSLIASFILMFAIGVPLAIVLGEPRILDGSALWFVWMASVILQRLMKQQVKSCIKPPRVLPILITLANPVLMTILLMTAYARAKAYAMSTNISDVLQRLSSGTQLYTIWTLGIEQSPTVQNRWFGAGDAALSMLGCGFIVWGFKLYECRRQLFSASGLVTILVSVAAAVGNVFLGAHAGFLMGLQRPEALAFAARMTTLALAIPAMKNVGGSTSLTVALMITNGILGQLAYPSSLNGVESGPNHLRRKPSTDSCDSTETGVSNATASQTEDQVDGANTVAAGITIGINGAAMGVAYLYENKSRSAPYAALAVTTYGVVTVVFIAVHPFRDALLSLV
ncbi:uncharacterized protein LMH87_008312 [Akanthomyces muscarius]|uniref:LrgB-like protein n=1 Tax=Akanthomyces muscarius TaxID=2231603 RepID=A0A9W8QJ21_AKAMU|nr:uncharacterized protein LMH87_008312 [Akanthomyces muscarius]KAJ4159410.1 hypothetical protein LMH87_008312 [Akanthomyces muscarius]